MSTKSLVASHKKSFVTHVELPVKSRAAVIPLLNQHLADAFDLYSQIKQAHWNVKGMHFIALHELFDKLAEEVEGYVDDLAERATALGGSANGTARVAAATSRLPEFPPDGIEGMAAVKALVLRFGQFGGSCREAIQTTADLGDAGTSDLFTGISRDLDKNLWFLEAHLQG